MNKKKLIILIVIAVIAVIGLAIGSSYALFTYNITKNSNFKTIVGKLELSISDTQDEDRIIINNLAPTKDSVALTEDGYNFTITNTGTIDASYTVYLDELLLQDETKERLSNSVVKVNLSNTDTINSNNTKLISTITDGELISGNLEAGESINYTLRVWLDYNADNTSQNKYYAGRIRIDSTQSAANNN